MGSFKFSIEGSVPLKEALARELGFTFLFEDSVNGNLTALLDYPRRTFMGCGKSKHEVHFVLPRDYEKALEYVRNYIEPEFKIGDLVVVLPEDEHYYNSEKGVQPLLKYEENYPPPFGLGFRDGSIKWYEKIRHATPEEIEEYKNPRLPDINGYSGVYSHYDKVLIYGCARLPIEWFKEGNGNRSIVSLELNSGVKINEEQIRKIKNYLSALHPSSFAE